MQIVYCTKLKANYKWSSIKQMKLYFEYGRKRSVAQYKIKRNLAFKLKQKSLTILKPWLSNVQPRNCLTICGHEKQPLRLSADQSEHAI